VLYQPRSRIVHHEGVSHGTSLTDGLKSYQARNQLIFLERMRKVLADQHQPNGPHVMRARDRAGARKIVLVIDHYVPEPDRDAGSRTMLCIIRALLHSGFVVKFWPQNLYCSPQYTDALQDLGVEVAYGGDSGTFAEWLAVNAGDIAVSSACSRRCPADTEAAFGHRVAVLRGQSAFLPSSACIG